MSNRTIPFGYRYENGTITINPQEIMTLKRIIRNYLSGRSLLQIAQALTEEKIEFSDGVAVWNKPRLMRIFDDERYLGSDTYPAVLDREIFEKIRAIKQAKNNQIKIDRKADIYNLDTPVICHKCDSPMKRTYEARCKCHERWSCTNLDCNSVIPISDETLLANMTEIMNMIISNPSQITIDDITDVAPSIETRKCNNEIARLMEACGTDTTELRKKMLEAVSLKYRDINPTVHIAKRMKADFEKSSPLSAFSAELCSRTVKAVRLHPDCTVSLILINDQTVEKESNI